MQYGTLAESKRSRVTETRVKRVRAHEVIADIVLLRIPVNADDEKTGPLQSLRGTARATKKVKCSGFRGSHVYNSQVKYIIPFAFC